MDCSDFKSRVVEYPDKELSLLERKAIERHADGCPPCGRELEAYRTMRAGMASLPAVSARGDFEARLYRRLRLEKEARDRRGLLPWGWSWRPAGLALAAALLLVAGGLGVRQARQSDRGTAPQISDVASFQSPRPVQQPPDLSSEEATPQLPSTSRVQESVVVDAPAERAPVGDYDDYDDELAKYLSPDGIPLVPANTGRRYVIDGPTDVPWLTPTGETVVYQVSPVF